MYEPITPSVGMAANGCLICKADANITNITTYVAESDTSNSSMLTGHVFTPDGRMHAYAANMTLSYKLASTSFLRIRLTSACGSPNCPPLTWISNSFTVQHGPIVNISISGFPVFGTAGQEILPRVILLDDFDNVVTQADDPMLFITSPEVPLSMCFECSCPPNTTVACSACPSNANFSAQCGFITRPNEGIAVLRTAFPTNSLNGERMTISVYLLGATTPFATGLTDPFVVAPAAPAMIQIMQEPTDMLPGHYIFPFVEILVQDRFGNSMPEGVAVTAAVSGCCSATSTISKPTSTKFTSGNGTAVFDDLLLHPGDGIDDVFDLHILFAAGDAVAKSALFNLSRTLLNESNYSTVELFFEPVKSYEFGAVISPAPRARVIDRYSNMPVVGLMVKVEMLGCFVETNFTVTTCAPVNGTNGTNSSDSFGFNSTLQSNGMDGNMTANSSNSSGNASTGCAEFITRVVVRRTSYCPQVMINVTDQDGMVVFENLTAGNRTGIGPMDMSVMVTAGDDASNTSRSFTVYNIAGMYVSVQPQLFFSAGRALSVDPEVVLCSGTVVPCPSSSAVQWWPRGITVSLAGHEGGLSGGSRGLTRAIVDGKVVFSNMTARDDIPLQPLRLKFALDGTSVSVLSEEVKVLSTCSIFLTMLQKPSTVVAGTTFSVSVGALNHLVEIDQTFRPVVNVSLVMPENTSSSRQSVQLSGNTSTVGVRGIATLQGLSIRTSGTYTLAVFAPGTSGSTPGVPDMLTFNFTVVNGPPSQMVIIRQARGGANQDPLAVQPILQILDEYGNAFMNQTGFAGALSVTASTSAIPGGGVIAGSVAQVNGTGYVMLSSCVLFCTSSGPRVSKSAVITHLAMSLLWRFYAPLLATQQKTLR